MATFGYVSRILRLKLASEPKNFRAELEKLERSARRLAQERIHFPQAYVT